MNKTEIDTFKDMRKVVETIAETVENIDITLNGKKGDRHDLGLVADVRNNIKWKNAVNRWIGALGISTIGLVGKQIFELFKRGN